VLTSFIQYNVFKALKVQYVEFLLHVRDFDLRETRVLHVLY